jgi:hypothetical protein
MPQAAPREEYPIQFPSRPLQASREPDIPDDVYLAAALDAAVKLPARASAVQKANAFDKIAEALRGARCPKIGGKARVDRGPVIVDPPRSDNAPKVRGGAYDARLYREELKPKKPKVAGAGTRAKYVPGQLTGYLRLQAVNQVPSTELAQMLTTKGRRWLDDMDTTGYSAATLANHLWQATWAAMIPPAAMREVQRWMKHSAVMREVTVASDMAKGDFGTRWKWWKVPWAKIPLFPMRQSYKLPKP